MLTYDREPLLIAPQDYLVDGQGRIENPVGLFGSKLEVDYYIITGAIDTITNLFKAVNMGGLEVQELVISNLASSFSVLSPSEKDAGVILLDIGSSTTEVTIFTKGIVRFDRMLATGVDNLIKVLAVELKIQRDIATKAIKNYCRLYSLRPDDLDEMILIKGSSPPKTITQQQLQQIIEPKVRELLNMAKEAIQSSDCALTASSGLALIGGISAMDGLAELAEHIFNMPVRVGVPKGLTSTFTNSIDMSYVTAIGLAMYGCQKQDNKGINRQLSKNVFKRAFQAAKDFVYDYF